MNPNSHENSDETYWGLHSERFLSIVNLHFNLELNYFLVLTSGYMISCLNTSTTALVRESPIASKTKCFFHIHDLLFEYFHDSFGSRFSHCIKNQVLFHDKF